MPSLSPTMSQGNIVKWHVKAGDEVKPGTLLADVETDKATLGFENQDDGFVAKILVADGTKDIPVGTPVAVFVEDAGDVAAFANYAAGGAAKSAAPAAPPAAPSAAASPAAPAKSYPPHTVRHMAHGAWHGACPCACGTCRAWSHGRAWWEAHGGHVYAHMGADAWAGMRRGACWPCRATCAMRQCQGSAWQCTASCMRHAPGWM